MKIGIIGGTGGMGEGFALRWTDKHDIIIGSRSKEKASEVAENYSKKAREHYGEDLKGSIIGDDNFELAKYSDVLILSIPYDSIPETCSKLKDIVKEDCIIISPIVPMSRSENGFGFIPLEEGKKTAGELVAEYFKDRSKIVSTFHTVSEVKLRKFEKRFEVDSFVCGDDMKAVTIVNELISEINGMRPIYVGPLYMTYQIEVLTPLLLNGAKKNKLKHPSVRLV